MTSTNPLDHARIAGYYTSAYKPRAKRKKRETHSTSQGTPRTQWPMRPSTHYNGKPATFITRDKPLDHVSAKAGKMWNPRHDKVGGVRILKGAAAQAYIDELKGGDMR